jgi:hypothetical protein
MDLPGFRKSEELLFILEAALDRWHFLWIVNVVGWRLE